MFKKKTALSYCVLILITSIVIPSRCTGQTATEYFFKSLNFYSTPDSMFYYASIAAKLSNNDSLTLKSIVNCAVAKTWLGEDMKSILYLKKGLVLISKKKLKYFKWHAILFNVLAGNYESIGSELEAERAYLKAIKLQKEHYNSIDPAYLATTYQNLGLFYLSCNKNQLGIEYLEKTKDLFFQSNMIGNRELGSLHIHLGDAYLKNKNRKISQINFLECINYLNDSNEKYDLQNLLYSYQGLSQIYLEKNNQDSIAILIEKMTKLDEQFPNQLQKVYKSHLIIGKYYAKAGHVNAAEAAYNQAIASAKSWFKDLNKNPEAALMHLEKARFYQEYKSLTEALPIYQDALIENSHNFNDTIWTNNPDYTTFLNPANGLDILLGKVGLLHDLYFETKEKQYLNEAFQLSTLITKFIYHIRRNYKAAEAKLYLSGKVIPFYDLAIRIAMEMKALTNEAQYDEWAFKFMEANKSLLLLETLSKNKNLKSDNLDDKQITHEKELQQEIAYYRKRIIEEKQKNQDDISQEDLKDWEQQVFDLKESHQLLLDTLREHYPEIYVQTPQFEQLTMKEVRNQMQKDEALISFFVGDEHLFAYLLRKDAFDIIKMDRVDSLQNQVEQLAQTLKYPPNSQTFQQEMVAFGEHANQIYQYLLQPLLEKLPTGFFSTTVKQLTIIPDDFLFTLPFEVLVQNQSATTAAYQDLDYLCKNYHIDYQFSAFMLNGKPVQKEVKQLSFFGFAPEFGSQAIAENRSCIRDELYSLRCSQSETENINAFFNGQVLLAEQANTEAFWQALTEADILHLATHVCLDPEEQLNTRVFLSDGYITALDLTGKQFSNELTVLSACDTGAGKLVKGEGLASIAREFMMAGSKSTLTSLWSVDDCSTSQIMEFYYQHLQTGLPKNEAIQKAKMDFLQAADMERAHPYYWAAFLQFGDKGRLFEAPFAALPWFPLLVVGLGLMFIFGLKMRRRAS